MRYTHYYYYYSIEQEAQGFNLKFIGYDGMAQIAAGGNCLIYILRIFVAIDVWYNSCV